MYPVKIVDPNRDSDSLQKRIP